ncbi:MAG: hypothetical protein V3T86_10905 [Planctomycetota bacterium]
MQLWEKFKGLFNEEANHLAYERLPDAKGARATANKHYFRVTLVKMYLKDKRTLGQVWYPAVQSSVACQFGSAKQAVEIPNIADESRLVAKQEKKGHVVAENFELVPLMPFRGGTVRLAAGLFAAEGQDVVAGFLGTMSSLAKILNVPQLSSTLDLAAPIANGIQALFGASGEHMRLVFHDTFVGREQGKNELRSGYLCVVRAPQDDLAGKPLAVVDFKLHAGGAAITDYDYMVFRVDVLPERDDWKQLTTIAEPRDRAIKAIEDHDLDEETRVKKSHGHLQEAIGAAYRAPEITTTDRRRVIGLLKEEYEEMKRDFGFMGAATAGRRSLDGAMKFAPTAALVGGLGEVTPEEAILDL